VRFLKRTCMLSECFCRSILFKSISEISILLFIGLAGIIYILSE
jgi:hypothetical protein